MHEMHFVCSFFSAARRTNQEAPPRLSGFWLVATVAVGVCGTRSARTVLALFPPSPLRLHRPIKADRGLCICLYSNPLALRALPLYSLQEHRGRGLKVTLRSAFVGFLFSLLELFLLLRNSPPCCGTRQGEE